MHPNILDLYTKAQSHSLEAQEVAWLESQTREHPFFGMAYLVLARHHLSNKSTIKDRALLKGAAYAQDRLLFRSYVQDVIGTPRPALTLEKQPPAESPEKPVAEPSPQVAEETAPEPVAEEITVAEPETTGPPADEAVETPATPEPETIDVPLAEMQEVPVAEETPAPEAREEAEENKEETVVEQESPGNTPEPPAINWFLNMHLKLRMDKYAGRLDKIRAGVRVPEGVEPAHTTGQPKAKPEVVTPATEKKKKKKTANTSKEPVAKKESKTPAPEQEEKQVTARPPVSRSNTRTSQKESPRTEAPVAETRPTRESAEYEIGAFSSFTFLEDNEPPEADESEIDTMMPLAEAVEIETDDTGRGPGQITFEERDRIVEVTVSPDELEKYFKGRLPVELNFSTSGIETGSGAESPAPEEKKTTEYSGPLTEAPLRSRNRRVKASEIIERFIEEEPTISRVGEVDIPSGDLAVNSAKEDQEWVTETLARIYEKQGNKARAAGIYEKLALRFPEKSDYFADLIQKLK